MLPAQRNRAAPLAAIGAPLPRTPHGRLVIAPVIFFTLAQIGKRAKIRSRRPAVARGREGMSGRGRWRRNSDAGNRPGIGLPGRLTRVGGWLPEYRHHRCRQRHSISTPRR